MAGRPPVIHQLWPVVGLSPWSPNWSNAGRRYQDLHDARGTAGPGLRRDPQVGTSGCRMPDAAAFVRMTDACSQMGSVSWCRRPGGSEAAATSWPAEPGLSL